MSGWLPALVDRQQVPQQQGPLVCLQTDASSGVVEAFEPHFAGLEPVKA